MTKNTRELAKKLVRRKTAHGLSRKTAKPKQLISSLGTERNYAQAASNYLAWCVFNNVAPDMRANKRILQNFLDERSEWVQQKTLDLERQALQLLYAQKLPYVQSKKVTILDKRSYSLAQVKEIAGCQSEKNSLTTLLALHSGIRAHEAATILPLKERTSSQHRTWSTRRFTGFPKFVRYTVVGKGGLCREIAVPVWLSDLLESRRRKAPIKVRDRGIFYTSFYDIGFGQAWSQSFTSASKRILGFSTGGHGLRHSYAKQRLYQLEKELELLQQDNGNTSTSKEALKVLSQELGHFRIDITFAYLR